MQSSVTTSLSPGQGVQHSMVLVVNFFCIFEITFINFCFVVALFDLVHNVKAINGLCSRLTTSENLFRNMSDASETAICSNMSDACKTAKL